MASAGTVYVDVLPRMDRFTSELSGQATAAGNTLGTSLSRSLSSTGSKLSTWGRTWTRSVTLPIVGAGVVAGKMAFDFEDAFTKISALSNASAGDIAKWKTQVLQLAGKTAQSPQDLANALYFLASAGLKTNQVMPALEASAKGAAVGLGNAADVAKITANALNAYAGSGLTATKVTSTLVQATKAGTAAPDEFATALGRILPIASKAGVSFDQVAGSLAGLSNIGLDVNEGTTAMRGVLQALVAPSSTAAKAMKSVGLSADQMRAAIADKGLLGAMQLLDKATGGNIDKLREIIPNIRALTGQFGLTGKNADQVAKIFDEVAHSSGALGQSFQTTAEGPAFQFRQQLAKLQVSAIQLGEKLLPIGQKIISAVSGIAGAFSDLPDNVQTAILAIAGIAAAVGPLLRVGGAVLKIAGYFTSLAKAAGGVSTAGGAASLEGAAASLNEAAGAITAAAERLAAAGATAGEEIAAGAGTAAGELEAAGATVAEEEAAGAAGGIIAPAAAGGAGGGILGSLGSIVSGGGAVTGGSILALLGLASVPETPGGPSGLFSWKDENAGVAEFTAALNRGDPAAAAFVDQMTRAKAAVDAAANATKPLTAQQQQLVKWWGANADQINVANRALAGMGTTAKGFQTGVSSLTNGILTNTTAQQKWGGWLGQTSTLTNHQAVSLAELTNAYYDAGGALNHTQSMAFQTAIAEGHAAQAQHVLNQAIQQMPKSAQTKITADTKGAQADVKGLGEDVKGVPDGRTTFTADTKQAVGAIVGVTGKIKAVPDGNAKVNVDTGDAVARIGAVVGLLARVHSVSATITTTYRTIGGPPGGAGVTYRAAGGIQHAASGMISQGPATVFGEGNYPTPWGKGAEAFIPLGSAGIGILGDALDRADQRRRGHADGGGGSRTVSLVGKLEIVNGEAYIRGIARDEIDDDHRYTSSRARV